MDRKTGILLINLGTPDATDAKSVRRYLRQFLTDHRVIESKGVVWWLILNGIILRKRPISSGRAYAKIWNTELNESPLRTITRGQAQKLAEVFTADSGHMVDWAMRYGTPSIPERIKHLKSQGCDQILLCPLYPQYSSATTASAMDAVCDTLKEMRSQPAISVMPPYFDEPKYIETLAASITRHLSTLTWQPDVIIASLHGLPVSFIEKGDPYQSHCETTVSRLRTALHMDARTLLLCYQSRSNRVEWIGPDTEETLVALAKSGQTKVAVVTPGFAADCVETLEEIQIRAAEKFAKAGGQEFTMIPCLNDSADSIQMLASLIAKLNPPSS